jgi:hypothetical protein
MYDKILSAIAACTLFIVIGILAYSELNVSNVTVNVQLKQGVDPFLAVKQIVPENTTLIDVKELNRSTNEYQIIVKTRRNKDNLLRWIRSSKKVEKVEVVD